MADGLSDVVHHDGLAGLRTQTAEPGWEPLMPYESAPPELHLVALSEVKHPVPQPEVELPLAGFDVFPIQSVFRHQEIALLSHEICKLRILGQSILRRRATVDQPLLGGKVPQSLLAGEDEVVKGAYCA